jgi:hypothetical protein
MDRRHLDGALPRRVSPSWANSNRATRCSAMCAGGARDISAATGDASTSGTPCAVPSCVSEHSGEAFAGSEHPIPLATARSCASPPSHSSSIPIPKPSRTSRARVRRTTHGARECIDACRLLGTILSSALAGDEKESVLSAAWLELAPRIPRFALHLSRQGVRTAAAMPSRGARSGASRFAIRGASCESEPREDADRPRPRPCRASCARDSRMARQTVMRRNRGLPRSCGPTRGSRLTGGFVARAIRRIFSGTVSPTRVPRSDARARTVQIARVASTRPRARTRCL